MSLAVPTKNVLGVNLALLDYDSAVQAISYLSQQDRPSAVSFCNTHLVAEAASNPDFCKVLGDFDLNFPDGMPLVWALNWQGAGLKDRVYGPYLMRAFFEVSPNRPPLRHFLFGSTPETLAALRQRLTALDPGANIVGHLSPPFRPLSEADQATFANHIISTSPDCIWVAMGGVKQERWIAQNIHRYPRGVFLAVGDAFALLSGQADFAPAWMQKNGLTWLYRLAKDPKRLASRYLVHNTLYCWHTFKEFLHPRNK